MKKTLIALAMVMASGSAMATTDKQATTGNISASAPIPLTCAIVATDADLTLAEQGTDNNDGLITVTSNANEAPTVSVSYVSVTNLVRLDDQTAVAGTDAYLTTDGTTALADNTSIDMESGIGTLSFGAVTKSAFSAYAETATAQDANLTATITVTCPAS